MARTLGIDHGTKRMGIAVSDELGMIAQPLEYIPAHPIEDFFKALEVLIKEREVNLIIVGMPRNMNGTYGPAAEKVRFFVASLKEYFPEMPIRTWDERLSSSQANRILIEADVRRDKRKEKVDKMAAAIFLQSYLDSVALRN